MLERARRLSDDEGLANITYQQADAQVHRFPPTRFDLCISRFGTMFFADPVAAFTNIGRALRPAARLVLLVWQERDRNEWATAIRQALTAAAATPRGPDPFSLADPTVTEGILAAAGLHRSQLHRRARARLLRPGQRHRLRRRPPPTGSSKTSSPPSTPRRPSKHARGCAPPSTPTTPTAACTSTRVPGSSRLVGVKASARCPPGPRRRTSLRSPRGR